MLMAGNYLDQRLVKCGACFGTCCYCTGFLMWIITAYIFRFSQEGKAIAGDYIDEYQPDENHKFLYLTKTGNFLAIYVACIMGIWTLIGICCVAGLFIACRDLEDDFEFVIKSTNGEKFVQKWNGKQKLTDFK